LHLTIAVLHDSYLTSAPNVVIVLIDDMGFGAPSANGGPINMPAMEKIAERGLHIRRDKLKEPQ